MQGLMVWISMMGRWMAGQSHPVAARVAIRQRACMPVSTTFMPRWT
jgi:hypothetical protein